MTTDLSNHSSNPAKEDPLWTPEAALAEFDHPPRKGTLSPVQYFHLLERLKTTPRTGWTRFGISNAESISDHMYRMAMMTMLAPASIRARLNLGRCTQMALVHDMAEAVVGDIVPIDGMPKSEKSRRERTTMEMITTDFFGTGPAAKEAAKEVLSLWEEYELSETEESVFVHDLDKIELLLQLFEYERRGMGTQLCPRVPAEVGRMDRLTRVGQALRLPEMREWAIEIMEERNEFFKSKGSVAQGFTIEDYQAAWAEADASRSAR